MPHRLVAERSRTTGSPPLVRRGLPVAAVPQGAVAGTATWRIAQVAALVATLALLAGLELRPALSLRVLWAGIIPLLPASWLLHPGLWRNICPLATLNMATAAAGRGRRLGRSTVGRANAVGILLLLLLVPARRFLFNQDATALALTITAVAAVALGGGFLFDRKAGFCDAICPILPVERLYGQDPLAQVSNPRCPTCTLCVSTGCIDLARTKSIPQVLSQSRRSAGWLLRPFGAFAAAFPGFVLGYYLSPNVPGAEAASVYFTVFAAAAFSWGVVAIIATLSSLPARKLIPVLGILALALYYTLGAGDIARAWNWNPAMAWAIRVPALALLAWWAIGRSRSQGI